MDSLVLDREYQGKRNCGKKASEIFKKNTLEIFGDYRNAEKNSLENEVVLPVKLREPKVYEKIYFSKLAEDLARFFYNWFLEDHTMIDKSSKEIKQEWRESERIVYFVADNELMHAHIFDDYIQLWDEYDWCIGNFDWSYLAIEIQLQWNTAIRKIHEDFFKSRKYREIFEKSVKNGRKYIKSKSCQH